MRWSIWWCQGFLLIVALGSNGFSFDSYEEEEEGYLEDFLNIESEVFPSEEIFGIQDEKETTLTMNPGSYESTTENQLNYGNSQCQSSTFGCCPDGISPAHGSEGFGCCASSEFGCCSDNYSPASGPYDEGCESENYKYGLCPDGLTAALDGNYLGCGCRHMREGCCPDGSTPAKGPNYEGCDCSTFEHGCCPDGMSVAQGRHFEGCKSCNSDQGCCPDGITPKGSIESCEECQNTKYGCCFDGWTPAQGLHFEGCQSPNPLEEIQVKCSGNATTGPCTDFVIKWFYDSNWGGCNKFWYGGCSPGNNHFDTEEECKGICVHPRGSRVCHLTLNPGSCDAAYDEFYFNKETGGCEPFVYGGCLGNGNRFTTQEACQHMCQPNDMNLSACTKPKAEGMCSGNFSRWFFDSQEGTCKTFSFSGCGGNDNRFLTENDCRNHCRNEIRVARSNYVCGSSPIRRFPRTSDNFIPGWSYYSILRRCVPVYELSHERGQLFFQTWEECSGLCPSSYPPLISLPHGKEILIERQSMRPVIGPVSIKANPPAQVSWFKNGKEIDLLNALGYELGSESSLILSGEARDDDKGVYMVRADNGVGSPPTAELEVIVYPLFSNVSIGLEKSLFNPGVDIVIPCRVRGYPTPNIRWYKSSPNNEKTEIFRQNTDGILMINFKVSKFMMESNLTISQSTPSHGGTYSCEAESSHSPSVSQEVTLSVGHGPGEKCQDRPLYKHCNQIIKYKLCGNKFHGRYCCRSCMEAGFIPGGQS